MKRFAVTTGFTLVELITAMTVTVMISGATVAMFRSVHGADERVERQSALQSEARAATRAIATALRNAYRPGDNKDQQLIGADDWLGDLPGDRISFFTISRRVVRRDRNESDVREVEFALMPPPDNDDAQALPQLMMRVDPTRNKRPDGGGVIQRVAANVIALNLQYHDGLTWRDEWPEQRRGWPMVVRVRLIVADPRDPRQTWAASRLVNFPHRRAPRRKDAS